MFFRITIGPVNLETPVVCRGTHQGVQLAHAAGALMSTFAAAVEPEPALFGGLVHTNPLGSSWNLSGAPEGSIVSLELATELAIAQGIELLVTGPSVDARGSYPIVEITGRTVRVRRGGPGLAQALESLRGVSFMTPDGEG